jgi:hypothetical protein
MVESDDEDDINITVFGASFETVLRTGATTLYAQGAADVTLTPPVSFFSWNWTFEYEECFSARYTARFGRNASSLGGSPVHCELDTDCHEPWWTLVWIVVLAAMGLVMFCICVPLGSACLCGILLCCECERDPYISFCDVLGVIPYVGNLIMSTVVSPPDITGTCPLPSIGARRCGDRFAKPSTWRG